MMKKTDLILLTIICTCFAWTTPAFSSIFGGGDYATYDLPGITMGYDSATMYYPVHGQAPFPAVTMSGGWTNTKEDLKWICIDLVKAGFVVLVFTPQRHMLALPSRWERGHNLAYETIEDENDRMGSPLRGKIDTDKIGMCGFSMGGGGAISATSSNVTGVKATVAMAPWEACTFRPRSECVSRPDTIRTPVFIFGGMNDRLSKDPEITQMYDSIPSGTERLLAMFHRMNHDDMFGMEFFKGPIRNEVTTYMIAFLKVYLTGDSSYQKVLSGDQLHDNIHEGWFYKYQYNGTPYVES